jgi:ABC-type multidrug transport system ATPase subunit
MQELYIDSAAHRFGSRLILSSVFLNCKVGEVVGLLGRNGSGKSTLLKIIFGSLRPDHMHLKVNDKLIRKGYQTREIAYLPQDFFIPQKIKIGTALNLYSNRYKNELLEMEIISKNLNTPIGELSGGQRRLVECLLILYSDSTFILMDEPFSQLAPQLIEELHGHIDRLKASKGFIITDHYYRQILAVASRIVLLHNGCNYAIGKEEDLILYGYLPDRF